MEIDKTLNILVKDDPYDLYGDFICVTIPEGFPFTERSIYHINGQGGLDWENGKWNTSWGVPAGTIMFMDIIYSENIGINIR